MRELHKVLITGDRNWSTFGPIERYIKIQKKRWGTTNLLIIEGGAPGADLMSKICAHAESIHVAQVDALWDTRHRSAGMQRNEVMRLLEPHEVMGFHKDIKNSKGTKGMLKLALEADIPAFLFDGRHTRPVTAELLGIRP